MRDNPTTNGNNDAVPQRDAATDEPIPDDLVCQQIVELVSDYVESALDASTTARFEAHLADCAKCVTYVDQVRLTVDALGHVAPPPPDPAARNALLAAFRDFARD